MCFTLRAHLNLNRPCVTCWEACAWWPVASMWSHWRVSLLCLYVALLFLHLTALRHVPEEDLKLCFAFGFCFVLFSWWWHAACGILVARPGIEPASPAVKPRRLKHWTTKEVFLPLLFSPPYSPQWMRKVNKAKSYPDPRTMEEERVSSKASTLDRELALC